MLEEDWLWLISNVAHQWRDQLRRMLLARRPNEDVPPFLRDDIPLDLPHFPPANVRTRPRVQVFPTPERMRVLRSMR